MKYTKKYPIHPKPDKQFSGASIFGEGGWLDNPEDDKPVDKQIDLKLPVNHERDYFTYGYAFPSRDKIPEVGMGFNYRFNNKFDIGANVNTFPSFGARVGYKFREGGKLNPEDDFLNSLINQKPTISQDNTANPASIQQATLPKPKGVGNYSEDFVNNIYPDVYDDNAFYKGVKANWAQRFPWSEVLTQPTPVDQSYIETPHEFEVDGKVYNTSLKGDQDAFRINQGLPQKYNTFKKYPDNSNTYKIKDYDKQGLVNEYFKQASNPEVQNSAAYKENKRLVVRDDNIGHPDSLQGVNLYPNKNAYGPLGNFTAKDNPSVNGKLPYISTHDVIDYDQSGFQGWVQRNLFDGTFPQNRFNVRDTIPYDPTTGQVVKTLSLGNKKKYGGWLDNYK